MTQRLEGLGGPLLLAALYFLAARAGWSVAYPGAIPPVWPPAGLAFAAVLLFGNRMLPGVTLGAIASALASDVEPVAACAWGLVETFEAFAGAWLIRRSLPADAWFVPVENLFKFAALAGFTSTALGAIAGAAVFLTLGGLSLPFVTQQGLSWWVSDAAAMLIVAPALLIWGQPPLPRPEARQLLQGLVLFGLLASIGLVVFGELSSLGAQHYPLAFTTMPVLFWIAYRFGLHGATLGNLLLAAIACWGTVQGLGVFGLANQTHSWLVLEIFLGISALSSQVLASVISSRRRAEAELASRHRELAAANRRLQELDQLKSNFVSTVSHELRTPLTSIVGFSEFLEDGIGGGPLQGDQAGFLHQIQSNAATLQQLVDDLLDFSRLETRTLKLERRTTELGTLLNEVAESLRPQAGHRRIALSVSLPQEPAWLELDPQRISQVLLNLAGNALKFTPDGGGVALSLSLEEREACVKVKDTGIGIAPENQPHVFEQFYQVDPGLTRRHGGTGLGLFIAQSLVEAHGGRIGVESRPGEGSTFWFCLPR